MIKYQQLQGSSKNIVHSKDICNNYTPVQSFKQRINQLKAKVKPSLAFFQPQSIIKMGQFTKQQQIRQTSRPSAFRTNQLFTSAINIMELRDLSQRKVIDIRVSYRAAKNKQCKSRQKNEQQNIAETNQIKNKFRMPFSSYEDRLKNKKCSVDENFEQNNKQNNNNNIQRSAFQIQDILITAYKSPNKTDRSLGSQIKAGQALCFKLGSLQNSMGSSQLKLKQNEKSKIKKLKKMSNFNFTSNISIDVRQCSARSNTEYGSILHKKNDHKKKQSDTSGRHLKTQSTTYRIK